MYHKWLRWEIELQSSGVEYILGEDGDHVRAARHHPLVGVGDL